MKQIFIKWNRRFLSTVLAAMIIALSWGGAVLAADSADPYYLEIVNDMIYIYEKDVSVGDLYWLLDAGSEEISYTDPQGKTYPISETMPDSGYINGGSVQIGGITYPVKMQMVTMEASFDDKSTGKLLEAPGRPAEKQFVGGYGGREQTDLSYVVESTEALAETTDEKLRNYFLRAWCSSERQVTQTYETQIYIPQKNEDGTENRFSGLTLETVGDRIEWSRAVIDSGAIAPDQWHTIAVTYDAVKQTLYYYFDGEEVQVEKRVPQGNESSPLYQGHNFIVQVNFGEGGKTTAAYNDFKIYYGSYIVNRPVSKNAGVAEIKDNHVYLYDKELTVREFLTLFDTGSAAAVYVDQKGNEYTVDADGVRVNGGLLKVDNIRYAIELKQEAVLQSDGSSPIDFWTNTFNTEQFYVTTAAGIGSKEQDDLSYQLCGNAAAASWPALTTGKGTADEKHRVLTYELEVFLPDEADNKFKEFYLIMKYQSSAKQQKEVSFHILRDGTVDGLDQKISLGGWYSLAITVNPYRDRAYFYLDGARVAEQELGDFAQVTEIRLSIGFNQGDSGYLYLDSIKGYYGSYLSDIPSSSNNELVEIGQNAVYVYDRSLSVSEFLNLLRTDSGALQYVDRCGNEHTDSETYIKVNGGSLKVNDTLWPVQMQKRILTSDGSGQIDFWKPAFETENFNISTVGGVGGKAADDLSYQINGRASVDAWPKMTTGKGFSNAAEKILTYEAELLLPEDPALTFSEIYFIMKYNDHMSETESTQEAAFQILRDGSVAGTDRKLSLGQWHSLAITLNPYRGAAYFYIDGQKIREMAFQDYRSPVEFAITMGFHAGDAGHLYLDNIFGYYGEYIPGEIRSRQPGVAEFNGDTLYVYDGEVTVNELLGMLDGGEKSLGYIDKSGILYTSSSAITVEGGYLQADAKQYVIEPGRAVFALDDAELIGGLTSRHFNEDGAYTVKPAFGVGGKDQTDRSYELHFNNPVSRDWPNVFTKAGLEDENSGRIVTYEAGILLPEPEADRSFSSVSLHLGYLDQNKAERWASVKLLPGGQAEGTGKTLSPGEWHQLAVTVNPYRQRISIYIDGAEAADLPLEQYAVYNEMRVELTVDQGKTGYIVLDDVKGYYGSYVSLLPISLHEGVVQFDGDYCSLYDAELTVEEFLSLIDPGASELTVLDPNGDPVKEQWALADGCWLEAKGEAYSRYYAIAFQRELQFTQDFSADPQITVGDNLPHYLGGVQRAVAGRPETDDSWVFSAPASPDNAAPYLRFWNLTGEQSENRIVTFELDICLPAQGQGSENHTAAKLELLYYTDPQHSVTSGTQPSAVVSTEDPALEPGQWHKAAVTVNTYRKMAVAYLDGVKQSEIPISDYQALREIRIRAGFQPNSASMAVFDDLKGYYGSYQTERAEQLSAQQPDITVKDGMVMAGSVVTPAKDSGGILVLACYDRRGILQGVQMQDGCAETSRFVTASLPLQSGCRYKAFVLTDLEYMRPVCEPEEYTEW